MSYSLSNHRNTRRGPFVSPTTCQQLPTKILPIDIMGQNTAYWIEANGLLHTDRDIPIQREDWVLRIYSLNTTDEQNLASAIVNGSAELVCDGSFWNGRASSAFVVVSQPHLHGGNIVPGIRHCQSAYRGELAGILGVLTVCIHLENTYDCKGGSVTIGCDCEGAIKAVRRLSAVTTRWKNFDLLARIRDMLTTSQITFSFKKVAAHQDKLRDYNQLD